MRHRYKNGDEVEPHEKRPDPPPRPPVKENISHEQFKVLLMEMYDKGRSDTVDVVIVLLECERQNGTCDILGMIETVKSFKDKHVNNKQS